MIFQFCIKSGDNFNLFKTTIISLRDSIILRTVTTTIDSLRRYIIVCKYLRDSRDAIFFAHIYSVTAVPVDVTIVLAEDKMWEQYPYCN